MFAWRLLGATFSASRVGAASSFLNGLGKYHFETLFKSEWKLFLHMESQWLFEKAPELRLGLGRVALFTLGRLVTHIFSLGPRLY